MEEETFIEQFVFFLFDLFINCRDNGQFKDTVEILFSRLKKNSPGRESELRQLRKSNTDYEQQNATIQTYLGGLHNAIDKMSVETQQMRNNNAALKRHLQHLRTVFTSVFKNITIPGLNTPSIDDIDNFMTDLCKFVRDEPNHPIINKVRNAVSQLDIQS